MDVQIISSQWQDAMLGPKVLRVGVSPNTSAGRQNPSEERYLKTQAWPLFLYSNAAISTLKTGRIPWPPISVSILPAT